MGKTSSPPALSSTAARECMGALLAVRLRKFSSISSSGVWFGWAWPYGSHLLSVYIRYCLATSSFLKEPIFCSRIWGSLCFRARQLQPQSWLTQDSRYGLSSAAHKDCLRMSLWQPGSSWQDLLNRLFYRRKMGNFSFLQKLSCLCRSFSAPCSSHPSCCYSRGMQQLAHTSSKQPAPKLSSQLPSVTLQFYLKAATARSTNKGCFLSEMQLSNTSTSDFYFL